MSSFNPIITVHQLDKVSLLAKQLGPAPNQAFVYSGKGSPLQVLLNGQRSLTFFELRWKYSQIYVVDMSEHTIKTEFSAPCMGDAFNFNVLISWSCYVENPAMVVSAQISDTHLYIKSVAEKVARVITRRYDVDEAGVAEKELSASFAESYSQSGLIFKCLALSLTPHDDAIGWISNKRRQQAHLEIERLRLESEDRLEADRSLFRLEANLRNQQLEQELERNKTLHEIELLKIKTEFYGALLKSGNIQVLALQLAQNPNDVSSVQQAFMQQQANDRQYCLKAIEVFIQGDGIEGFQLADAAKQALANFIVSIRGNADSESPALPAIELGQSSVSDGDRNSDRSDPESSLGDCKDPPPSSVDESLRPFSPPEA